MELVDDSLMDGGENSTIEIDEHIRLLVDKNQRHVAPPISVRTLPLVCHATLGSLTGPCTNESHASTPWYGRR